MNTDEGEYVVIFRPEHQKMDEPGFLEFVFHMRRTQEEIVWVTRVHNNRKMSKTFRRGLLTTHWHRNRLIYSKFRVSYVLETSWKCPLVQFEFFSEIVLLHSHMGSLWHFSLGLAGKFQTKVQSNWLRSLTAPFGKCEEFSACLKAAFIIVRRFKFEENQ